MKVTIYQEPCWLLEAAELVYGLVNQIPVEKLAGSGPYCIPPDQVRRIQAEACTGLDVLDELTQFYFRGVPLEGVSGRLSCLGCALLYSFLEIDHPQVDDFVRSMEADWRALCESGFHVEGIDGFSLSFEPAPAGKLLSLARELAALQVPPLYRMQLLEVFSAFDRHLERVECRSGPSTGGVGAYRPAAHGQWFPYGDAPRHGGAPHERSGAGPEAESQLRLCVPGFEQLV